MKIVGNVVFGLLVGHLLFLLSAFLGMSIDSLQIASLIVAAASFLTFAAFGRSRMSKPYWISPIFSAIPIFAVAVSEIGSLASWTWCVIAASVLVAGLSGAYVGARLRSHSRLEQP